MRGIGVVIAIEREAHMVLADSAFAWKEEGRNLWASSRWPIRLVLSGVGKAFAAYATARVADGASLILSLGTSGGLCSDELGGLVLASEFVEHDMEAGGLHFTPGVTPFSGMVDPVMKTAGEESLALARAAFAEAGLAFRPGRVTSGDSFIDDPSRARLIRERTRADAVDMESAAVAKVAHFCGLSPDGAPLEVLAVRSLSDTADRRAGRTWLELVDEQGSLFDLFLRAFAPLYCGEGGAPSPH